MTTTQIKDKLLDYNRQFKKLAGTFKSFEIVFDYINFLASEPYIVNTLNPIINYIEKESEILDEQTTEDLQNLVIDYSSLGGTAFELYLQINRYFLNYIYY